MSLMEMLEAAGYPREEMFHHESDLYVYATPLTGAVICRWARENNISSTVFDSKLLFSKFRDQITGRMMYDIAFQWLPWWEEKVGSKAPSEQDPLE